MTKINQKKDGSHLAADILASLKREPSRPIKALAAELGFSTNSIGVRIADLYNAGEIDYIKAPFTGTNGNPRLWFVCDTPRQPGLRKPAVVIIRRDWAIEALFGPAHKEAA